MLGLRYYATTATQMFRRATFSSNHALRASSSNAAAVEAAASSTSTNSGSDASVKTGKEAKDVSSQEAENVKKQKRGLCLIFQRFMKFFINLNFYRVFGSCCL